MKEFSVEMAADIVKSFVFVAAIVTVMTLPEKTGVSISGLNIIAMFCVMIIIAVTCESFIRLFSDCIHSIYVDIIKNTKDVKNVDC